MATRDDCFSADSAEREVAQVALEAAALSRRIFSAGHTGRRESSEARQALLALALTSAGSEAREVFTPRAAAFLLGFDRELALDALAELVSLGLAEHEDPELLEHEDVSALDVGYEPTELGTRFALDLAARAARFLPGWPPS